MIANNLHTASLPRDGFGVYCTVGELFSEAHKARGLDLHFSRKTTAMRAGDKRSAIRGRGMEFFESRPYVPQDEMRSIDWKVSARLNELFTKVYVEERSRPIYLAIDLRASMFFGSVNCFKSVLAARLAARLAQAAVNGGDHVGCLIFTETGFIDCPIRGGQKNLARLFGKLSEATQKKPEDRLDEPKKSWPAVLKRIGNRLSPGSMIFMISDFLDLEEHEHQRLFRLRKKADVFALSIFDPLEANLADLGFVGMAYNQERILFNSSDKRIRKNYWDQRQAHEQRLLSLFAALNIPKINFSTGLDLDAGLRAIIANRGSR